MDQYSSEYSSKTILDSHYQVVSNMNSSLFNKYYYSSWQEQAVFVWPPRCYCCSFCKREFKSAQALGGHMNVHRRDRARLKHQSQNQAHDEPLSKSQSKATTLPKSQKQSPARLKSKTVALMTNSSTLSLGEPSNISHLSSPIIKKRLCSDSDLKRRSDEKGAAKDVILLDDHEYVEANRSVVISMAASEYSKGQNRSMFSSFPLLHKPYCWSGNNYFSNNNMPNHISREVELHTDLTPILGKVEHGKYCFSTSEKVEIRTSSMEDIDLELRLGDPPAISS